MKFGRRCQLSVEVAPNAKGVPQDNVVIPPDFTVEFHISRASISSAQTGTFRIYNLGEKTRNLLQKDLYAVNELRAIQFRAGYEDFPLALCFNGQVLTAYSYRRGVDFITEIEAFDGGLAMSNSYISQTIVAGTPVRDTLVKLARSLKGTTGEPIIGDFPGTSKRGEVLCGNTWDIILEKTGGDGLATIDNGQVKALQPGEALRGQIPVITAESGLLGSPERSPTNLQFDFLFEPRLTIGQIVELQSVTNRIFNGSYKVIGFTHQGTISPVESGECRSTVGLFFGTGEWNIVAGNIVQ